MGQRSRTTQVVLLTTNNSNKSFGATLDDEASAPFVSFVIFVVFDSLISVVVELQATPTRHELAANKDNLE